MFIIAVTGGIAMGKSYVSNILQHDLKAPIFDSDKVVHSLLDHNHVVVQKIKTIIPSAVSGNKVDRKILGDFLFSNPDYLTQVEAIIHPLVKKERERFLQMSYLAGRKFVILDIPLLFEKNIDLECDISILISTSQRIQNHRFLNRIGGKKGMIHPGKKEKELKKLAQIRARQMPDLKKRARADFILYSGMSKISIARAVKRIVAEIWCMR